MSNVEHPRLRDGEWLLAAVGLLAALLVGCSRTGTVEVSAAAPPTVPVTAPSGDVETFQGSVASLDTANGMLVVAVQIVWTPVLKADPHERRVAIGPQTRWEPLGNGMAALRVGDEVQVEATSGPDGTWRARKVSLFDID